MTAPATLAVPAPVILGPAFAVRMTLLLGSMMTVMAGAVVAAALPLIKDRFADIPNIDLWAKLVLSTPALAIALTAPFSGWFADAVGRKTLFLGGLVVYVLAGTSGLYVENLWWLLLGRVGLGIGVGAIMTASTALVSDYFTGPARVKFMGTQAAFMSLAGVIFMPMGGALAQLGWHAPFAVYFAALPVLALVVLQIREPGKVQQSIQTTDATAIPWPTVILLFTVGFLAMLAFYLGPVQVPFLMRERYGANELHAILPLAAVTVVSATVSSQYGKINRYFTPIQILMIMFVFVAAGYAAVGLAQSEWHTWAGLITTGIGSGLMIPTLSTWLMRVSPAGARGRLSGGLIASLFAGQFVSPFAVAVAGLGTGETFFAAGVILLVVAGVLGLVGRFIR
jgi:MFS family permease